MTGTPRVSVVIPTYRGGELLLRTVDSVLAQTLTDWELLVVLDGCDLPAGFPDDPRIRVVRQVNRGESVARNVGIVAARADVVAFVDDDDLMLPRRLERQLALLDEHPEVALVHTKFEVIDIHGDVVQPGRSGDVQYADLLRGDVRVLMPTIAARTAALLEVGLFHSTLRTGQDLDLIYRVAREYRLGFVDEVLTHYRRHGDNASGDVLQAGINLERILGPHLEWATSRHRDDDARDAREGLAWARQYGSMGALLRARTAWRARDLRGCAAAVREAVRLSPRQAARDLLGNRWPVRSLLRARRMIRGTR